MSPNDTHDYGAKTTAKNAEKSAEKPRQSFEKIIEKKYANIREITITITICETRKQKIR